jgi:cyclophilin family peptidyl-prolyl cis-trans isomerase/HEAT repeat protein
MRINSLEVAALLILVLAVQDLGQTRAGIPQALPHLKRDHTQRVLYPRIIQHEDERVVDDELIEMLNLPHAGVKRRVIAALGRIGYPLGINPLVDMLNSSRDPELRAMAAFSLGQIGSSYPVTALLGKLENGEEDPLVRSRAAEALGKIASNKSAAESLGSFGVKAIGEILTRLLPAVSEPVSPDKKLMGSMVMTALFRLKNPSFVGPISAQLVSQSPDLRWEAANALARIGEGLSPAVPALIVAAGDSEVLVRAHAARALGVAKDGRGLDPLVKLLSDHDQGVVAEAVLALGRIGDRRAVDPLVALGERQLNHYKAFDRAGQGIPPSKSLLLLAGTALGNIKDERALPFLKSARFADGYAGSSPEFEIAVARLGETAFFDIPDKMGLERGDWKAISAYAQGLGQIASDRSRVALISLLFGQTYGKPDPRAVPEILKALAEIKSAVPGLREILLPQLKADDVIVRATAAELLGRLGDNSEAVITALQQALKAAHSDKMNDARIAIIEAASRLGHPFSIEVLAGETRDSDYVVRRRAAELVRESGVTQNMVKLQIGKAETGHDKAYWRRMADLMLSPKNPEAVIHTRKGEIRLELFAQDAPMTVDNFVQLSKKGFYNGLTFMRVVPDFVVQGGDPRGDTNGGPEYQIRDEINLHDYMSGTLGMALSGKDTGGSQFFISLSPQPHLDGGYTVFGQVTSGKDILNSIARDDVIERIEILDQK